MDYLIYDLAAPHVQQLADAGLLSADERLAAGRRGGRYVLVRSLLRLELARRLGCSAAAIRLHYNGTGKPLHEGIHFNLSHSGDCLALAFDRSTPVGIDVERIRPRARLEGLAARIMGEEQLEAFRQRRCPVEEFYACWCAAEALVKRAGTSIWQAAEYPFLYEGGQVRPLREGMPEVRLFTPCPGYRGAIAYGA